MKEEHHNGRRGLKPLTCTWHIAGDMRFTSMHVKLLSDTVAGDQYCCMHHARDMHGGSMNSIPSGSHLPPVTLRGRRDLKRLQVGRQALDKC